MLVEQDIGIQQYIIKIHDPLGLAFLRIELIDIAYPALAHLGILAYRLMVVHIVRCRYQIVLGRGYARKHLSRPVCLVIQLKFSDTGLYSIPGIGCIVDGECLRKSEKSGIVPQYAGKYGMESTHPQAAGLVPADYGRDTLLHLPGRLVGKGQGHDGGRLDSALDYGRNLPCKHTSFPGTGSRDNHRSSAHALNCLLLSTIQTRQIHFTFFLNWSTNLQKFYLYLHPNFCFT